MSSSPFLGRVPPHSDEAERYVLGACLIRPEILDELADIVVPADFYSVAHEVTFEAILALRSRGSAIDAGLLAAHLGDRLPPLGGASYLVELLDTIPTTAGAIDRARLIAGAALKRRILSCAIGLLERGYDGEMEPEEYAETAEAAVLEATKGRKDHDALGLGQVVRELVDGLAGAGAGEDLGILTGIPDLDDMLCGLQRGEVTVVAAPPSMGKSALAMTFARNAKVPSLLFPLEQPRKQLAYRVLAGQTGIPVHRLRRPRLWLPEERQGIVDAAIVLLKDLKVWIDDRSGLRPAQIRSASRRAWSKRGARLFIVDYVGLVRPAKEERGQNREREIAAIMQEMKELARELDAPAVILSQMNRDYAKRKDPRPAIEDLRDSGAIGQDADTVLFPWRPLSLKDTATRAAVEAQLDHDGELEPAEIIVGKNRNGPVGTVPVWWDRKRMEFKARDNHEDLYAWPPLQQPDESREGWGG